jgi:hypothetical protein
VTAAQFTWGSADILVRASVQVSALGPAFGTQFFRIADVRKVYRIVHEAMQRQKK